MYQVENWLEVTYKALWALWQNFISFIPNLIGAIIVFVVGWYIAKAGGRIITRVLQQLRLDRIFEQKGWKEILEKADMKITISEFIGEVSKWVLVIVFLLASVEILGFVQFANFLRDLIVWLPDLVIAIAIFVVAVIVADIFAKIARASVEKIKGGFGRPVETFTRWAVYIFAGLAILMQLGIAVDLIRILFGGLVAGLSIAFGIAFGLGGKDLASEILRDFREKLK